MTDTTDPLAPSGSLAIPGPFAPGEIERFLATHLYAPAAFLIDEVLALDPEARRIEARMRVDRPLPLADCQRGDPRLHPPHVSGPELVQLTGNLGALHAWFFHGCRWDEGWVGFGNRIHRADFRSLARRDGPPLTLVSRETRARVQARRIVLRFEFEFSQGERAVYRGDQSAIFVKDQPLEAE